jgi:phosphomannomutase
VTATGEAELGDVLALIGRAVAWIKDDPDPASQAELQALLDAHGYEELAARFDGPLQFGTAGLRGVLGGGETRMNRATVRRASAGLAAYLQKAVSGAATAGVVIGCDARHGSAELADETARTITGAGLRVWRLPAQLPTPVLAFAVRSLGCAAGVMITASHNPPEYNGYKVYLGDGAQIVPPADAEISADIGEVDTLRQVPMGDAGLPMDRSIVDTYIDAIIAALPAAPSHDLSTVYTPLHGVGRDVFLAAFARAGYSAPHVVALQSEPDGDFPTLPKPNPEEPGALELAITDAARLGVDLVIANDPDADRLAVAIPTDTQRRQWRVLRGDELGAIIGAHLLDRVTDRKAAVVATTIVSSGLLRHLADAAGVQYIETLTGFKWIMHETAAHPQSRFLFGYEEAIGYAVNDVVRDKDGISAALVVAGIAAEAKAQGRSLADLLDELARRCGLYATDQFALQLPGDAGLERADQIMAAFRSAPPQQLNGRAVTETEDLAAGTRRSSDGHETPLGLPPSNVVVWRAEERIRVVVRPSGTEPKLKFYLQIVVPVGAGEDVGAARRTAACDLGRLRDEVLAIMKPGGCGGRTHAGADESVVT